jgi:hypothetical protein
VSVPVTIEKARNPYQKVAMNDHTLTQVESAHQIVGMVNELDKLTAQTAASSSSPSAN